VQRGNAAPKQEGGHELCPVAHNRFARWDGDSRGYQPVGILPAFPAPPESGIQDSENNEVSFIGSIQGVSSGSVDRVTGQTIITFYANTPRERFFNGICRPAQKLF
jgi:hypothetical protein